MSYIDGYLIKVPKKNLESYKKMASDFGPLWTKHGALRYTECISDDIKPEGMTVFFPDLMDAGDDDLVVFSFIEFESREHRDEVNAKVLSDPMMAEAPEDMPFTMDNMYFGGFMPIVDLKA